MIELKEIKYDFIKDLTWFFILKYREGEIKDLEQIVRNVKKQYPFMIDMAYIFDETIWFPNKPEYHKNLVQFKVQLSGYFEYMVFHMFLNKDAEPFEYDS